MLYRLSYRPSDKLCSGYHREPATIVSLANTGVSPQFSRSLPSKRYRVLLGPVFRRNYYDAFAEQITKTFEHFVNHR